MALVIDSLGVEGFIRSLIEEQRMTHWQVSMQLEERFGQIRGISEASVKRFCNAKGIHRSVAKKMTFQEKDNVLRMAVDQVGPTFGRKMMTGFLRANGIQLGQKTVRKHLNRVQPVYAIERRHDVARMMNPIPYIAEYGGHKGHMDQNEKLVMFGATHVLLCDGYSKRILKFATMPVKNNVQIYDMVFRPAVQQFGIMDQIRVDHGKEFYLSLFGQEQVHHLRHNAELRAWAQTESKRNLPAERMWPEFNSRVSYPIKEALTQLCNEDLIDMDDELTKAAVSNVTIKICSVGIPAVIDSWNQHPIPGKGSPVELWNSSCRTRKLSQLDEPCLPTGSILADMYRMHGGTIKNFGVFGIDPIATEENILTLRERQMKENMPDLSEIFYCLVNREDRYFKEYVMNYIKVTEALAEYV